MPLLLLPLLPAHAQEKLATLEQERLRALEAAARARAEVQELSESRRKLQWQSKLLEKMSEVIGDTLIICHLTCDSTTSPPLPYNCSEL